MTIYAYTSFSFSYLSRARVLAMTLKSLHPDWSVWAVIVDKEPEGFVFDLTAENFDNVLFFGDLFGEESESWLFGHDIVEACTAVKGRAARYFLDRSDCDKLLYFDPDIAVFNLMDDVSSMLNSSSIVLTPHQVDPEPKGETWAIKDNEVSSLKHGVFNLGFVAVANDGEGIRFSQWWDDRLRDWCHDRLDVGVFVDQKWCNLVPCFFENVKIIRDPGYNVASWNLSQRKMHYDDSGAALINNRPLRFFHFTKLGPVGDVMTQRYAADNIEIYELWWWYRRQVLAKSTPDIRKGYWHYGAFVNGVIIPKSARELYRSREDLRSAFPRPFEIGAGSYYEWLLAETKLMENVSNRGFLPV